MECSRLKTREERGNERGRATEGGGEPKEGMAQSTLQTLHDARTYASSEGTGVVKFKSGVVALSGASMDQNFVNGNLSSIYNVAKNQLHLNYKMFSILMLGMRTLCRA
jgi:hypothetical protein